MKTADHKKTIEDLSARARTDRRAFERLRALAGSGDTLGQYVLAAHHDPELKPSRVVKPSIEVALHWYRHAAERGEPRAQYSLGRLYGDGRLMPADARKALRWMGKAAAQNMALALRWRALVAERDGDDAATVFDWYRRASLQGDLFATLRVAALYKAGDGVGADAEKSFAHFRAAAQTGNEAAIGCVAECYFDGTGVARDAKRALQYARKGADRGDGRASFVLGRIHDTGFGVPENPKEAFACYKQAAKQGYAPASRAVAQAYDRGRGVTKSVDQARFWHERERLAAFEPTAAEILKTMPRW